MEESDDSDDQKPSRALAIVEAPSSYAELSGYSALQLPRDLLVVPVRAPQAIHRRVLQVSRHSLWHWRPFGHDQASPSNFILVRQTVTIDDSDIVLIWIWARLLGLEPDEVDTLDIFEEVRNAIVANAVPRVLSLKDTEELGVGHDSTRETDLDKAISSRL